MTQNTYKIKPLTGEENYQSWKTAMESICGIDNTLSIVKGEELRPNVKDKPLPPIDLGEPDLRSTYQEEVYRYQIDLKEFKKEQKDWDRRNLLACSRIRLSCEKGPQSHIKSIEDEAVMWNTLKRYENPNTTVATEAFIKLTQTNLSDLSANMRSTSRGWLSNVRMPVGRYLNGFS